jgi:adenosylmethionine-8-amino-7-oxononanoate aminotransferase
MAMSDSFVFHRSVEKKYPIAQDGSGVYITTSDGRKVLDGSSGAAVSSVGHGNVEVISAICDQARQLAFAHSSFFTSGPAEELAETLIKESDGAFEKVMLLSSGSEAVESALKLARQYHIFNGQSGRVNIIGREHAYHGNTLGALAAGKNPSRRAAFDPMLSPAFHHVRRCFHQQDGGELSEEQYEDELLAEYEEQFERVGPSTIAAVIIEPVGGATLGAVTPTKGYLSRLSELCQHHGILTIFDEVMCGMGRVGSYHAWQYFGGVKPDLQTIGKGLAGGYQPLSGVLIGTRVNEIFQEHSKGSRAFVSGHTYQDHSIACAAALAVQRIIIRDKLTEQSQKMGVLLRQCLEQALPQAFKDHNGGFRGAGLFQAVDFGSLSTPDGSPIAKAMAATCLEKGLAVYLCSPLVNACLICPPLVVEEEHIRTIVDIFVCALQSLL